MNDTTSADNPARLEIIKRLLADPLAYPLDCIYPTHNPAQVRCINAFASGEPIDIYTLGNGTGKTHVLISIMSGLMFPTKNPLFNQGVFRNWKWPKTIRLCAPEALLDDAGPIQRLMLKLFPSGRYSQQKSGKKYFSQGFTDTGWSWDVMTYNQAALQAAGETKGLILYSEPPPRALFNENLARLRAGGKVAMEMTPLFLSPWVKDEYIDVGVLRNDKGEIIGKVNWVSGDVWENCVECPGGRLQRIDIEKMLSQYTDEERELREKGTFGHLAGRIYKVYDKSTHEWKALEGYYLECFEAGRFTLYNVIDPHDRKPYAVGWYAVFPNEDVVTIAEFPDESYQPFHKMTSFPWTTQEYCEMIRATEIAIGIKDPYRVVRWVDPNFGQTTNFATKKTIRQEFFDWGNKNGYPLNYGLPNDKIQDGHMAVRGLLGNPALNQRSKMYVLEHCRNHSYGATHYAYKESKDESKGVNEEPQLIYKDFMDLWRYGAIMGFRYIPPPERSKEIWKAKTHWSKK